MVTGTQKAIRLSQKNFFLHTINKTQKLYTFKREALLDGNYFSSFGDVLIKKRYITCTYLNEFNSMFNFKIVKLTNDSPNRLIECGHVGFSLFWATIGTWNHSSDAITQYTLYMMISQKLAPNKIFINHLAQQRIYIFFGVVFLMEYDQEPY